MGQGDCADHAIVDGAKSPGCLADGHPRRHDIVDEENSDRFVIFVGFIGTADIAFPLRRLELLLGFALFNADQTFRCNRKIAQPANLFGNDRGLVVPAVVFAARMQGNRHEAVGPGRGDFCFELFCQLLAQPGNRLRNAVKLKFGNCLLQRVDVVAERKQRQRILFALETVRPGRQRLETGQAEREIVPIEPGATSITQAGGCIGVRLTCRAERRVGEFQQRRQHAG